MAYAVDPSPALPVLRRPRWRNIAWATSAILMGGGAGLVVLGGTLSAGLLLFLGAMVAVMLAPELLLVALVVAGGIKGSPLFAALPVDLTLLALLGTVIATTAAVFRHGVPRIPMSAMGMLVLAGWLLLGVLWSTDPSAGMGKAIEFSTICLLIFAAPIFLVRTREHLERVCMALVAVGVLVALSVEATGDPRNPLTVPGGNEIEAALYPGLAVVAILGYLLFEGRGGRARLLWLVPLPIVAPVWVGAGSRGVLLAGVFAVLFAFIRRYIAHPGSRPLILAMLLAVIAIVAFQGQAIFGSALQKYQSGLLTTDTGNALGERSYLMGQGIRLAGEHPLGIGTGSYAEQIVRTPLKNSRLSYPHNIVVEFAAENGILAAAFFLGLVGAGWAARRRTPGGAGSGPGIFAGALLIFGLMEAQFSFDIISNRVLWFALGMAFATATLRATGQLARSSRSEPAPEPRAPVVQRRLPVRRARREVAV
jgi:O-antigen ligase